MVWHLHSCNKESISYSKWVYTQSLEAGQGDVYPIQEG